jgi:hypothetical protein
MICPSCQTDSIPFAKFWLKSGLGTYHCPNCGAVCRIKKSTPQRIASMCLGGVVAGICLFFRSWTIFAAALVVILILDAWKDYRFRRLELVEAKK